MTGSVPPVGGWRTPPTANDIDFEIKGQEMQYVEIELDPGESAIAEAGAMMFKDSHIGMDTVFGGGGRQAGRYPWHAGCSRQASADRREPVHDRVHARGAR